MKRIVLCADDYGQAPAISEGILDLLGRRRLTATSCLVTTPYWREYAPKLKPYQDQADIGLHFNLTEGERFTGLNFLIIKAHLFNIKYKAIVAELNAQLDAFSEAMGCLPRYIDGHQHVHHLPVVRQALVDVYQTRLKGSDAYIRLAAVRLRPSELLSKKAIIYATGVRQLRRLLERLGIPHNHSFSGVYGFGRESESYPVYFRRFLEEVENGGLIMCHPGMAPDGEADPIGGARHNEYKYLISEQFERDLRERGVELARFSA